MMDLKIHSSPNRDGISTNLTTSYRPGETLHLMTIVSQSPDQISQIVKAFENSVSQLKVSQSSKGHGGLVINGCLIVEFTEGDDSDAEMGRFIAQALRDKSSPHIHP